MSENKKVTVDLEEVRDRVFETARLVFYCLNLSKVLRHNAYYIGQGSSPPADYIETITDMLMSELDVTLDGLTDLIERNWGIPEEKIEQELYGLN